MDITLLGLLSLLRHSQLGKPIDETLFSSMTEPGYGRTFMRFRKSKEWRILLLMHYKTWISSLPNHYC